MAVTTSNFAYALKTLWPQKRVQSLVYQDNPLLALLKKNEKFTGKNAVIATRYADPQGRSATFANAQTNKGNNAGAAFTITRAKDYAIGSVETEVLLASEDDPGALIDALETESSALMNSITRSLAIKVYGDGSGAIGQVDASGVTAGVFTLLNPSDVTNFEVNQVIRACATKTGGTQRTGTGTITSIDRGAGTITYSGTITSIAASDYLYTDGDYDAALKGLAAWLPVTAPGSTAFFGVDRSVDVTRLGGARFDVSTMSPEEGLVKALYLLGREGGNPDYAFCNHSDMLNVQYALGSKVMYEDFKVGEIGFKALMVNGPKKPCRLVADQNCPKGYAFALTMADWTLHSLGKAPRMLNVDGQKILREYNADSNELRMAYYAQLACEAPGHSAVITLPA